MSSGIKDDDIETLYVTVCDINGIFRGKRIPLHKYNSAANGSIRMPLSVTVVDIWGEDIESDGGVFETGDADGICVPTERGLLRSTRSTPTSAILPLWMSNEDGSPYLCDPRHALSEVIKRFKQKGLTPVVATELEFYLMDASTDTPMAPISPATGNRLAQNAVLSLSELEDFEVFLNDVYAACDAQNIPADAAISENGCGQFEVNLLHVNDPLKAADDALFFKRIVKRAARKHGMVASFMAKPFGSMSGNGFHVHFSLLDDEGNNVFNDGSGTGSDILRHAVAGLVAAMPGSMLIFAPHLNSYRRLLPGAHAPTNATWGYENRTAAIRIPGGDAVARRIEHRVAGADANPYLVLAVLLGSALTGIENKQTPEPPLTGSAYNSDAPALPDNWQAAIDAFAESTHVREVFDETLCDLILACKKQELAKFGSEVTSFEYQTYLENV